MYHHFYHLKYDPFADAPDPEFLFLSPSHKTALQAIRHSIEKRRGFLTILGAAGLGKTILLRAFLEGIHERQRLKTIQIFYPKISCQDMFEIMYRGLGLRRMTDNPAALLSQLHQALSAEYNYGWNVVLIVDDVQDMSEQTFASLLRLADLKTSTGVHLLQIVLVGLPAWWHRLNMPLFRPFKQRRASHVILAPLTSKESLAYIRHRLAKVLVPAETLFMPGALKQIIRVACGNPRVLNTLCANILITGVLRKQKPISLALVQEVIGEFQGTRPQPYVWRGKVIAAGVLLGIGLWWGWQSLWPPDTGNTLLELSHSTPAETDNPMQQVVPLPALQERTEPEGSDPPKLPKPDSTLQRQKASPVKRETTQREPTQRGPRLRDVSPPVEQAGKHPVTGKAPPARSQTSQGAPQARQQETARASLLQPVPEPTMRVLNIRSNPAGATVTVGQQVVGSTPVTVQLVTGIHTITLEKSGYMRISYDINLYNHHKRELYHTLRLERGGSRPTPRP